MLLPHNPFRAFRKSVHEERDMPLPLPITRRRLLGAAAFGVPAILTGCAILTDPRHGRGAPSRRVITVGSNASDELPKKSLETVARAFTQADVEINTTDHTLFQENINRYLAETPDDVFTWYAGYRMRLFADEGLAADVSDVWAEIGSGYRPALKAASTASDGRQYFVPFTSSPWAVFYRRGLWEERGYRPPATLDELTALARRMKRDGLVPFAFADKEGWPAMGTFDILNMRMNGYDFHVSLLAGRESWTDGRVRRVFDGWRGLLEYHQRGALRRTWQEAGRSLAQKKAGMYLSGMFLTTHLSESDRADLDFFTFPEIDPAHGTDAIDAPVDGYMISAKARDLPGAKALLRHFASGPAQNAATAFDPSVLAAGSGADTSRYSPLQRRGAELVARAANIAQFMERDTDPEFAVTVMRPALRSFIDRPAEIRPLLKEIEARRAALFR
jgi:multiple sugar transport system substrate-binding protein